MSHDNAVTTTGVRFAMIVAFATDVLAIPLCQKLRSRKKAQPARMARRDGRPRPFDGRRERSARNGSDNARRQNPTATGPALARRTRTGAAPMMIAPMTKAVSARPRSGWSDESIPEARYDAAVNERRSAGLCDTCEFMRVVSSSRNAMFYLCEYSKHDPSFPKYPAIPVRVCGAYKPSGGSASRNPPYEPDR